MWEWWKRVFTDVSVNEVTGHWRTVISKTVTLCYCPYFMNEKTTHLEGQTTCTRIQTQKLCLLISNHGVKADTEHKRGGLQTFPKLPMSRRRTSRLPSLQSYLVPEVEGSKVAFTNRWMHTLQTLNLQTQRGARGQDSHRQAPTVFMECSKVHPLAQLVLPRSLPCHTNLRLSNNRSRPEVRRPHLSFVAESTLNLFTFYRCLLRSNWELSGNC